MIVLGALTLICAIAWAYLAYMGWGMAHMDVGLTMAVMPLRSKSRASSMRLPPPGRPFVCRSLLALPVHEVDSLG